MSAPRRVEVLNRYEFCAPFIRAGFLPYIPEVDAGVDFILYHEEDDLTFKVQLKARWTVEEKYLNRRIWIAFGDRHGAARTAWCLMPHDTMVREAASSFGASKSWAGGSYSTGRPGKALLARCADYEVSRLLTGLDADKMKRLLDPDLPPATFAPQGSTSVTPSIAPMRSTSAS